MRLEFKLEPDCTGSVGPREFEFYSENDGK